MSHYMTDTESAVYSSKTAELNMVGAGLVPSKTTASGKTTKHGNFLCHSCKAWK